MMKLGRITICIINTILILTLIGCAKSEENTNVVELSQKTVNRLLSSNRYPEEFTITVLNYYVDDTNTLEYCYTEYSGLDYNGNSFTNSMISYNDLSLSSNEKYIVSQDYDKFTDIYNDYLAVLEQHSKSNIYNADEIEQMINDYLSINKY